MALMPSIDLKDHGLQGTWGPRGPRTQRSFRPEGRWMPHLTRAASAIDGTYGFRSRAQEPGAVISGYLLANFMPHWCPVTINNRQRQRTNATRSFEVDFPFRHGSPSPSTSIKTRCQDFVSDRKSSQLLTPKPSKHQAASV